MSEGSRADVSFLVGLLLDKFAWHLPLYRQHQRLFDAGITVSRAWLTQLATQAAALLTPIYEAQLASIPASRVKAMDETPIKAGRAGLGKMKACYFWLVYGELHEICFPFFESRAHKNVENVLGLKPVESSVLLSDGDGAYETYARTVLDPLSRARFYPVSVDGHPCRRRGCLVLYRIANCANST